MKPTLKSINAALPRFDLMRREFMYHGETGWSHGRGFLASAYANLDVFGNVDSITLYAVGDAWESRHYHLEPGTVDITEEITEAIHPENYYYLSAKLLRGAIVEDIQKKIADAMKEA